MRVSLNLSQSVARKLWEIRGGGSVHGEVEDGVDGDMIGAGPPLPPALLCI